MIDISVTDLVKSFDLEKKILDGVSFQIDTGERVGLLGKNGAGKSTLFNILTGELDYDSGQVLIAPGRRVGLISQIPVYPAGYTVEDVLRSAFQRTTALKEEMDRLTRQMEQGDSDPQTLRRYGELTARFEGLGGYDTDTRKNKVCSGLQIGPEMREQLFDRLQPLHGLDGRWLYRLRIACCLHDIGFASGRKGHHKKGMRIVEQDTSLALLPEDRSLVAQLVRYHRKAWPAMRHRRFAALGKKDREALNKAAALIRMADALDYRHMEAVRDVAIDLQPGKVVLTLSGAQDCAPEQDRLLVKGDLFMHIFGVELECVCPIL